ncbi:hypothetical protein [Streptomyces sp. T028]|uniref:hypothetical protein n=1 Tax=Streptomyces sp. T028 TaxID=3394379 RepID=UPI003A8C2F10
MDPAEPRVFRHERVHNQVDRGILEAFRRSSVDGPYPYPLGWVTVRAEARAETV